MSFVVSLFDWLNEESEDEDGGGAGAAVAAAPKARYEASSKALDAVAVTLSAEEYNHIAAINVKTMEADTAHLEVLRQTQDRLDRAQIPLPADSDPGYEIHTWLATVLAPCPELMVVPPKLLSVAPVFEPAPVMLDGTTAAALASAQSQLSEEEYNHILNVQRQLAELELEAEMQTARKLMPRKMPKHRSMQPGGCSIAAPSAHGPAATAPVARAARAAGVAAGEGLLPVPAVARAAAAGTGAPASHRGPEFATPIPMGLPRPGDFTTPMALPADALAAPGAELATPPGPAGTEPSYDDLFGFTPKR